MNPVRLRVCIVDDEPPARRALDVLLRRQPDVRVVGVCGDVDSARNTIRRTRPDVVFLDVQMPGGDGFEVLEGLSSPPLVVFVTAYERYALPAFEARALDYLLKPFSDERFEAVLQHVREALGRRRGPGTLVVRDGSKTVVLRPADIEWLEADDYYVRVHAGAQRPLVRRTLHSLLAELAPYGFLRVHRSAAVNLAAVQEVRPLPGGDAEARLAGGQTIRVSRSHRAAVLSAIGTGRG